MAVLPPDPVFCLRHPDMGSVHSLCFHQNARLLAGTVKGKVYLWDLQTNRSSLNFEVGQQPITTMHHTLDMLITQEKGGNTVLWSMTNTGYVRQRVIECKHYGFCHTALYGDQNDLNNEQLLFYPFEENVIGLLRLNDPEAPPQLLVPDDPQLPKLGNVTCFKPFECASQMFLLAGYESGHFLTWDLSSGVVVDLLHVDVEPLALDYDSLTNRGIVGGPSDKLIAFNYQRQSMQMRLGTEIAIKNSGVNCVRVRYDQKVFATGGWDGRVRVFSWKSLRPLAVLTEHKTGGITDIAYSDGKVSLWNAPIMAASGIDGQISLWDLYN